MAKKKQSKPLVTPSTSKKQTEVASTSKKQSGVASLAKKPSGVASPAKKPSEVASTSKKPSEVASPPKKQSEVTSTSKKPSKVASPPKKPSEVVSTPKKPSEVASLPKEPSDVATTSKKTLKDVSTAKNKKQPEPVKTPPPESSSDDEEETDSSSEGEDETCKDLGKKNPETPASAPIVTATANQNSDSESESETESESDSETEEATTKTPAPATAPIVTATANQNSDSESESETENESDSETEEATTKTPAPATAAATSASPNKKRQNEGAPSTEVNASKRVKTESGTETAKKAVFQRVWSEEDEIVLLQGLIDFKNNTGKSASDDTNGFFESVKKSFSFEVKSVHQFTKKIWSLKNKYMGNTKSGAKRSFTKPHDLKCLPLAKMIWGNDGDSTAVKSKKKIKVEGGSLKIGDVNVEADWFERSFIVGAIMSLGVVFDEKSVIEKWNLVPVKAKKRIEEMYKSLKADELKCVLLKSELLNEVSSVIAKSD